MYVCVYIYIYIYIFVVFIQFLTQSSENPWYFLRDESNKNVFCCVNEVTFGKCLWMGAGCPEKQPPD